MKLELAGFSLLATLALCPSVQAQISSDGSLSTTVITDDAVNFLIENGDRSGSNLFHSFSEFSIPNLGSAYFNNAIDITNIFSRVTGGNISDIQGLIRANGTANLFLINPAGIVFGENASLDVGGSFFATTAESVVFGDDIEFSAIEPQEAPLLTINITPGLQMGANPGSITVQGVGHEFTFSGLQTQAGNSSTGLQVTSGNTIGLLGGEISLEGGILTAPAGRIEIGAANSGVVNLNSHPQGWELYYDGVESFGDIQMSQQALIDTSGDGGGDIQVQGANISLASGSFIFSQNQVDQAPGVIQINATDALTLTSVLPDIIRVWSQNTSSGNSADIQITASRLEMSGSPWIVTDTRDQGNAGNISVNVRDSILLDTLYSSITAITSNTLDGSGNAGNITVDTKNLRVLNGSLIVSGTFSDGNAGNTIVNASESIEVTGILETLALNSSISSISFTRGAAGNTTVNTAQLTILDGGEIGSVSSAGGNGGKVIVNATEFIQVQGGVFTENIDRPSAINAALFPPSRIDTLLRDSLTDFASGNSGSLIINTPSLTVTNGAEITVQNFGLGDAGNLEIQTDSLTLGNQGLISAISNSGGGGNIILQVQDSIVAHNYSSISADILGDGIGGNIEITTDLLSLNNNAQISTNSEGLGQAGNINIFFDRLETNQGLITATSTQSGGGNINLTALGSEIILRDNSLISTSVFDSIGGGGDITINTDLLVTLEDSDIRANAVFGQGGNIFIITQGLFLSPDSQISASSQFGIDGLVTINSINLDSKIALIELPANLTSSNQTIVRACGEGENDSLEVTGRGGLPTNPYQILENEQVLPDLGDFSPQTDINLTSSGTTPSHIQIYSQSIVEANAWIINERGNVELVVVVPNNNQNLGQVASSCSGEVGS